MCVNKCGVIARVRNGVIEKLDPNPNFIKSRAMLCARGNAGVGVVYDPDRLKYPLIRTGKRGEGKWKRISWDAALDEIAERLGKIRDGRKYQAMIFAIEIVGDDQIGNFIPGFVVLHETANQ
jgi:thiosulfate reductase/polysulfide reductase chain A